MVNIYDLANQVASDLTQVDQFVAVKAAIAKVKADDASYKLYHRLNAVQVKITSAREQGKTVSEEDSKAYETIAAEVKQDKNILALLDAEGSMYQFVNELQGIMLKPMRDIYKVLG
ncbi:MAG: YlbF family regulator [Lactobacillus sp.]|nr:YlbF family regulator [Lactobacillus sp.]MDN6042902.1 YlbF family regulator [Lactobacillus sp.]MDN6051954.1 YlbF family regulator [Lactobacillus sp.]